VRDLLPAGIYGYLRDRYLAGTSDAVAHFPAHAADEDALTGALGQAFSALPVVYSDNGSQYFADISYRKLRGRGKNAPEKRFGADGIFQIRVTDRDGAVVRQKALPFQAKKEWRRKDTKLIKQCEDMIREFGQGIVVDFSPTGYLACRAAEVVDFQGQHRALRDQGRLRDLGHVLADDFLE
jgi:hypothetical protein